ncbi:MAG: SoxR reducing system RseC family protein [Deltaproteobacteria bacterium]|nr:SoxR reducing system RseC family protein [Deltaproteobacteria bacterium]
MIREEGIVEEIRRNTVVIKVEKSATCAHCADKDSCSVAERNMLIEVRNILNAKEGDRVEVSVPEGTFIKLSLMVYIFPVAALMAGAFLGNFLSILLKTDPSATAAITAALFLVASFICLKIYEKKKNTGEKYSPRMTRILIREKAVPSGDNI